MATLSGKIPTWLNGSPSIPVEDVNVDRNRPMKRRKGAFGIIGKSKGQLDPSIQITMPLPADKDTFLRAVHDITDDDAESFTFEWAEGNERFIATGCDVSADKSSSNQDGDGSRQVTIIPDKIEQVA